MRMNFDLNGKKMHVTATDPNGEVNADTVFEFTQNDSIVSARYSGGKILLGYLVGKIENNKLEFRYAQANNHHRLDGGQSNCEINNIANGKLQLIEHYKWLSREGSGTNIFEEI